MKKFKEFKVSLTESKEWNLINGVYEKETRRFTISVEPKNNYKITLSLNSGNDPVTNQVGIELNHITNEWTQYSWGYTIEPSEKSDVKKIFKLIGLGKAPSIGI